MIAIIIVIVIVIGTVIGIIVAIVIDPRDKADAECAGAENPVVLDLRAYLLKETFGDSTCNLRAGPALGQHLIIGFLASEFKLVYHPYHISCC